MTTLLERPNYSGQWEFSRARSSLQIARPDEVALHIEHEGSTFHLERTLTFGRQRSTFAIDLAIGGDNDPVERGDALVCPSLDWDGDALVFESRILRTNEQATNVVRYHLEDEGEFLVADEHFEGPAVHYDNHWVFRKDES